MSAATTNTESQIIRLQLPRAHFTLSVDLQLPPHGITVLFGESGSGKTSLLRCIAGLERAKQAYIQLAGLCWQDDDHQRFVPTWQRPIGYVFQEPSLFNHLSVQDNLLFGVPNQGRLPVTQRVKSWLARQPKTALPDTLRNIIELLGIAPLLAQSPQQLSGGERQRVAIARALASNPRVLLLDEPLASLDLARRHEVMPWLEHLRDALAIPMLYVTHDIAELERLANHVVVLEQGQCIASSPLATLGNICQLNHHHALGLTSWIRGHIQTIDSPWQRHLVRTAIGSFWIPSPAPARINANTQSGSAVLIKVHARDVVISREPAEASTHNHFHAVISSMSDIDHTPGHSLVYLRQSEHTIKALVHNKQIHDLQLHIGSHVWGRLTHATTR